MGGSLSQLHDRRRDVLAHVLAYVELNPVRAGMAATSETYPWSSARAHVCGDEDPLLATHDVYLHLGATPDDRQQAWRVICQAGMQESELAAMREAIQKLGSDPLSPQVSRGLTPAQHLAHFVGKVRRGEGLREKVLGRGHAVIHDGFGAEARRTTRADPRAGRAVDRPVDDR